MLGRTVVTEERLVDFLWPEPFDDDFFVDFFRALLDFDALLALALRAVDCVPFAVDLLADCFDFLDDDRAVFLFLRTRLAVVFFADFPREAFLARPLRGVFFLVLIDLGPALDFDRPPRDDFVPEP